MRILTASASYLALLLLIMPATTAGMVKTAILLILGLAWIIWKKPSIRSSLEDKTAFLAAALFTINLSCCFYSRWTPSSKVRAIAAILHMSNRMLIIVTAVCLFPLAALFLSGVLQKIRARLAGEKQLWKRDVSCCLIASAAVAALSQLMVGAAILSMGLLKFVWGILIVCVVILALYCLCGEIRVSIALGTCPFMIVSTANVYVYSFRSRLFEPIDIFSIGTAMNVADNYSVFPVPASIIIGWVTWCALLIYTFSICSKETHRISHRERSLFAVCGVVGAVSVFCYTANLKTYHWDMEGAQFNGYILDFVSKIREAYISEPDGYSLEQITQLSDRYGADQDLSTEKRDLPHIIVIMDEAFSDLSVLGEISTDTEVTPFISSLKENVISGYALASVYGGNTANSEYEFLTGNSMAWLSPNAVPYQQYVRSPAYSMVSCLKSNYGYHCTAMHPYLSDGWNRPSAYAHLGFDECLFMEDFPQEDYIRRFISDREMFEKIVDTYENQHEEPLFLFGVTMQNHGDYTYRGENYTQTVSLVGYENDYPEVEQYLSLLHETDKAVEYLISYFSGVNEDVVIVFFGDHQPKIDEEFYEEVGGGSSGSLASQQQRYMVPFFIWTNYDMDEQHIACTSLNYLSSYVYEAAGLSLPAYNRFLSEMEESIPAINANGFYSLQSQNYLPFDMASEEEQSWLEMYEQLQYNALFDDHHRSEKFFPLME